VPPRDRLPRRRQGSRDAARPPGLDRPAAPPDPGGHREPEHQGRERLHRDPPGVHRGVHLLSGAQFFGGRSEPAACKHHRGGEGICGVRGDTALGLRGTGSLLRLPRREMDPEAFIALLRGMAGVMGPRNVSSPTSAWTASPTRSWTPSGSIPSGGSSSDRVGERPGAPDDGQGRHRPGGRGGVERCREHNLNVAGSFIVGYPGETERDYEATKDLIAGLCLDDVFVSSAEPIPGTPLADLAVRTPREKNPAFVPTPGVPAA